MDTADREIHQFAANVLGLDLAPLNAHFSPISHVIRRKKDLFSIPSTPRSLTHIAKTTIRPSSKTRLNLHLRTKTHTGLRLPSMKPASTDVAVNSIARLAKCMLVSHIKDMKEASPSLSVVGDQPVTQTQVTKLNVTKRKENRQLTMLRTHKLSTMTVVAPVVEGRTLKTTRPRSDLGTIPEEVLYDLCRFTERYGRRHAREINDNNDSDASDALAPGPEEIMSSLYDQSAQKRAQYSKRASVNRANKITGLARTITRLTKYTLFRKVSS